MFGLLIALTIPIAEAKPLKNTCKISEDKEFFQLLAHEVEPFVPSVDEDGNTYLKGAELQNTKAAHYRKQYANAPVVRLTVERYASLTSDDQTQFLNLESNLLLIDPECNEVKIFYGNLIGQAQIGLETYFKLFEMAIKMEHEPLLTYLDQRVELAPKTLDEIFDLVKSDVLFDVDILGKTLDINMVEGLSSGLKINYMLGGELALLKFAQKGGRLAEVDTKPTIYLLMPSSKKGLKYHNKTVILTSTGKLHAIGDLDIEMFVYAIGQLGVRSAVVELDQLYTRNGKACELDEVGKWFQLVDGARRMGCQFNEFLVRGIFDGGWKNSIARDRNPISYQEISRTLSQYKVSSVEP